MGAAAGAVSRSTSAALDPPTPYDRSSCLDYAIHRARPSSPQQTQFRRHSMVSRRDFFHWTGGIGLSSFGGALLAACGASPATVVVTPAAAPGGQGSGSSGSSAASTAAQ